MVFTEGCICPFLPSPRAEPVSLPGAGLVPRAGPPSSPSNLHPDEPWVPRSHAGLPPLEQAGGPTKPIWRESVPIRETLLTHQGLYCLTPGTTTTTNNTKVQQDMLGVFGKEPPPLKHGHVWVGWGVGGCRPDTLAQAARAGGVAGSEAPPDGSGDGAPAARGPGSGARLGRTLPRQVRERCDVLSWRV